MRLFAPGSRGKTDVMRSDTSEATAEHWARSVRHRSSRTSLFGSIPESHSSANFQPSSAAIGAGSHVSRRRITAAQHWRLGVSLTHILSQTTPCRTPSALRTWRRRTGSASTSGRSCSGMGSLVAPPVVSPGALPRRASPTSSEEGGQERHRALPLDRCLVGRTERG
jgi:hypothetical protein